MLGTGFNGTAPDMYTRFDSLCRTDAGGTSTGLPVVDAAGNLLLDAVTYAAAHGTGLVFDGTETRAANGGAPHKLAAADPTHSGTASDVMFPSPAMGEARDDWSAIDVAILKDLGYIIMAAGTGTGGGRARECHRVAEVEHDAPVQTRVDIRGSQNDPAIDLTVADAG